MKTDVTAGQDRPVSTKAFNLNRKNEDRIIKRRYRSQIHVRVWSRPRKGRREGFKKALIHRSPTVAVLNLLLPKLFVYKTIKIKN